MRRGTYAVVAVIAILVGLGIGYLLWGTQVTDLQQQVEQQQSDLNHRVTDLQNRIKAAEERARQEAAARKVLEDTLHRVHPLK